VKDGRGKSGTGDKKRGDKVERIRGGKEGREGVEREGG